MLKEINEHLTEINKLLKKINDVLTEINNILKGIKDTRKKSMKFIRKKQRLP